MAKFLEGKMEGNRVFTIVEKGSASLVADERTCLMMVERVTMAQLAGVVTTADDR